MNNIFFKYPQNDTNTFESQLEWDRSFSAYVRRASNNKQNDFFMCIMEHFGFYQEVNVNRVEKAHSTTAVLTNTQPFTKKR